MLVHELTCPFPISLYQTVTSHGWIQLAPWKWDKKTAELGRSELLKNQKPVFVNVTQTAPQRFIIKIDTLFLETKDFQDIESAVTRWLSLDWDPKPAIQTAERIDVSVAKFIKSGGGRFLRSSTFYEDFVKTVCTINTNWGSTVRMVSKIVDHIGDGVFPTPKQIIATGELFMRQKLRLGFRAKVLMESSYQLLNLGLIDHLGNQGESPITLEALLGLRGIGPYSAKHLMMLSHDFSSVPVDSEVSRYCKERYGLMPEEIEEFFDSWGSYKFLGYKLQKIFD